MWLQPLVTLLFSTAYGGDTFGTAAKTKAAIHLRIVI